MKLSLAPFGPQHSNLKIPGRMTDEEFGRGVFTHEKTVGEEPREVHRGSPCPKAVARSDGIGKRAREIRETASKLESRHSFIAGARGEIFSAELVDDGL